MAATRYASDKGLTRRMVGTVFGLGLLYVVLAAALIALGFSAAFVLIMSGGLLFGQWYFSDTMALSAMRAKVVTPEQAPQLHAMVDRLCAMADMPKPRIAIADTDVPNAFATGRSPSRSVVCVTTGHRAPARGRRARGRALARALAHRAPRRHGDDGRVVRRRRSPACSTRMWMWGGMGRNNRDQNAAIMFLVVMLVSRRRLRAVVPADPGALALPRAVGRPHRCAAHGQAERAGVGAAEDLRRHRRRSPTATCARWRRCRRSPSPRRSRARRRSRRSS